MNLKVCGGRTFPRLAVVLILPFLVVAVINELADSSSCCFGLFFPDVDEASQRLQAQTATMTFLLEKKKKKKKLISA